MAITIQFESEQAYQVEAIEAAVELFRDTASLEAELGAELTSFQQEDELFSQVIMPNLGAFNPEIVKQNLRRIQDRSLDLPDGSTRIAVPTNLREDFDLDKQVQDFSIEMETGTGKTYVYLRTALELFQQYGMTKFIIVVPSVAIREGVLSSLRLTKSHFQQLYGGLQYDYYAYDSKAVTKLRQFATSSHPQILVINIAAFASDDNIIRRPTDALGGIAPIEFIRAARPIVIMDEPQKLGSVKAAEAIELLNPLVRFRYSATHKERHHLINRLTPVDAYQRRLVKQINVLPLTAEEDANVPFVEVKSIHASAAGVTATALLNTKTGRKQKTLKRNDDLAEVTGLSIYNGWIVEDVHAGDDYRRVEFSNGRIVREGTSTGVDKELWQRQQIRMAIEEHLGTELRLLWKAKDKAIEPIKPLTLFFIDHVANYFPTDGKFRQWFEDEYEGLLNDSRFRTLRKQMPNAKDVHRGYFAMSKQGAKDSKEREGSTTKDDEDAFNLIMRDKERLLSFEEPVRFIFSHSALSEGWDNPNVFVICNLQDSKSVMRRRQQLGRGLRLPVMANGERCRLDEVNQLVVVATEEFESFAGGLQREFREDGYEDMPDGAIKNARNRVQLKVRETVKHDPAFLALWDHIKPRTRFNLAFDSNELVKRAVLNMAEMGMVKAPQWTKSKHVLDINDEDGVTGKIVQQKKTAAMEVAYKVPDILVDLAKRLPVSRDTIWQVIEGCGRKEDARRNPAMFAEQVRQSIHSALAWLLVERGGLEYTQIPDEYWSVDWFDREPPMAYSDRMLPVTKSIYEAIPYDSNVEKEFAEGLEAMDDVKLFVKLPSWFKVSTPVGGYNPDWAVVREDADGKDALYLVRETKGSADERDLFRDHEKWKVAFGKKHFAAIHVDYKLAKTVADL